MLYLKMMSAENLPDSDTRKSFRLLCIAENKAVLFGLMAEGTPAERRAVFIVNDVGDTVDSYVLDGNAYLMNENGRTIASMAKK